MYGKEGLTSGNLQIWASIVGLRRYDARMEKDDDGNDVRTGYDKMPMNLWPNLELETYGGDFAKIKMNTLDRNYH